MNFKSLLAISLVIVIAISGLSAFHSYWHYPNKAAVEKELLIKMHELQ